MSQRVVSALVAPQQNVVRPRRRRCDDAPWPGIAASSVDVEASPSLATSRGGGTDGGFGRGPSNGTSAVLVLEGSGDGGVGAADGVGAASFLEDLGPGGSRVDAAVGAPTAERTWTAGALKRKLWTRLDAGHTHAISGAAFLVGGVAWLGVAASAELGGVADECRDAIWGGRASLAILAVGAWNAASALPMASDERIYVTRDLDRYHALAFRWGGSAQLVACAWLCWWFSGSYPFALVPAFVDRVACLAAMASIGAGKG